MATHLVLGTDPNGKQVVFSANQRRLSTYVLGTQGMGKTTLLMRLALADIQAGEGVAFITPHGDAIEELLAHIPKDRIQDVVLWQPANDGYPCGLHVFECADPENDLLVKRVAQNVVTETFRRLWGDSWGEQMHEVMRIVAFTITRCQGMPEAVRPTLADYNRMLTDAVFRKRYIDYLRATYPTQMSEIIKWWDDFATKKPYQQREQIQSTLNKTSRFSEEPFLSNIFGQPTSSFNLRQVMDTGKILLVDLGKGRIAHDDASILGALLIARFYVAALSREDLPPRKRKQFHLIADEFQDFASYAFFEMFEQARKYRVDVVIANQNLTQLQPEDMQARALGAGNKIIFQVTADDAGRLHKEFNVDVVGRKVIGEHVQRNLSVSPWFDLKRSSHSNQVVRDLVVQLSGALDEWEQREQKHLGLVRLIDRWRFHQENDEQYERELIEKEIRRYLWRVYQWREPRGALRAWAYLIDERNFQVLAKHIKDTYGKGRELIEAWINRYLYQSMSGQLEETDPVNTVFDDEEPKYPQKSNHINSLFLEQLEQIFGRSYLTGTLWRGWYDWNSVKELRFSDNIGMVKDNYFYDPGLEAAQAYWRWLDGYSDNPFEAAMHIHRHAPRGVQTAGHGQRIKIQVEKWQMPLFNPAEFSWNRGREYTEHWGKWFCDLVSLDEEYQRILEEIWQTLTDEHRHEHWANCFLLLHELQLTIIKFRAWGLTKPTLVTFSPERIAAFIAHSYQYAWFSWCQNYHMLERKANRRIEFTQYRDAQLEGVREWYEDTKAWIEDTFSSVCEPLILLAQCLKQEPVFTTTGQSQPIQQSVREARSEVEQVLAGQSPGYVWVKLAAIRKGEQSQFRDVQLANVGKPPKGVQKRVKQIKEHSSSEYGRDRSEVEQLIYNRRNLETLETASIQSVQEE